MTWRRLTSVLQKTPFWQRNPNIVATTVANMGVRKQMFSMQQGLPRLPVPPLQQTLNKFLDTVKPLYNEDEFRHAEALVKGFGAKGGVGPQLQSLLEERGRKTVNWLEDWWLNVAYLDYRTPVAIHVNPGIMLPVQNFNDTQGQINFAAKWVSGVLDYKVMIDEQTLPVQYMGKYPQCMKQFFMILSACRIPGKKRDMFVVQPPTQPNPPKHITVIHNNNFFSVDVYGSDGNPLSIAQLEQQLHEVVKNSTLPGPPIGILTADDRDSWGKIYSKLIKDRQNKHSLEEIQSSICALCLDKPIPCEKPEEKASIVVNQMNHGGGINHNSCNRWFDKTIQFIIGTDGAVGLNYEHSSAEGPPIISIVDHTMAYIKKGSFDRPDAPGVIPPKKLPFNVSPDLDNAMNHAMTGLESTIDDLNMVAFKFDEFGKQFIKDQKISPDAFLQISFQYTYHRMYNKNAPTYESGSLRRFQGGRTETIRSCSQSSDAFCKAMLDTSASDQDRSKLLYEAVLSHKKYTEDSMSGNGVDRHLLGLKLTAIENGINMPDFFMDPVYTESVHWRLSTSQVPSSHDALLCFGPVVPDGYGVCYNPMSDHVNIAVSAWNRCKETDAQNFVAHLKKSLTEMRDLLVKTNKPQAKL